MKEGLTALDSVMEKTLGSGENLTLRTPHILSHQKPQCYGIPTVLKNFYSPPPHNSGSFTHPRQPPSSTTQDIFLKVLLPPPLPPHFGGGGGGEGVHTMDVDVICVCDNNF